MINAVTSPLFSIVIPTRQRHETLEWSLRTCLDQSFDDYQIVVCDNCSSPETAEVVKSLQSDRIRYVRAPEPLAMVDNWNLAVSNVDGEYVILIGDDDGILPHALRDLAHIIRQTRVPAIRWPTASYFWPGMPPDVEHVVSLPVGTRPQTIDGQAMVKSVMAGHADRNMLPMLYNAAIHRSLLEDLQKQTGTVFAACNPDIYSGLAFALLAGEFVSTQRVLSINATSAKSNGYAHFYKDKQSSIASEFDTLSKQSDYSWPETVPYLGLNSACAFEAYTRICSNLYPNGGQPHFTQRQMITTILQDYRLTRTLPQKSVQHEIEKTVSDSATRHWLQKQFDTLKPVDDSQSNTEADREKLLGCSGSRLRLDGSKFKTANVLDACQLCNDLLSYDQPLKEHYPRESRARRFVEDSKRLVQRVLKHA
ncbi:MAG: glycosyltransferase family 2 protein [Fuerstiella sp.]|nr:glycosyltransferase family 2 protein [Fuerstiella sp.]MCP4858870.1 glycosyltransferase family 2 protein [Fuerstiella sp.]